MPSTKPGQTDPPPRLEQLHSAFSETYSDFLPLARDPYKTFRPFLFNGADFPVADLAR